MSLLVSVEQLEHGKGLPLPQQATIYSSGYDLAAAINEPVIIKPGCRALIPTGYKWAIPPGYEGQVRSRSGLALNKGIFVLNSPGTIDADYRGEVRVILANLGTEDFTLQRGDRIAQLVIQAVICPSVSLVETLPTVAESHRTTEGFGSTGITVQQISAVKNTDVESPESKNLSHIKETTTAKVVRSKKKPLLKFNPDLRMDDEFSLQSIGKGQSLGKIPRTSLDYFKDDDFMADFPIDNFTKRLDYLLDNPKVTKRHTVNGIGVNKIGVNKIGANKIDVNKMEGGRNMRGGKMEVTKMRDVNKMGSKVQGDNGMEVDKVGLGKRVGSKMVGGKISGNVYATNIRSTETMDKTPIPNKSLPNRNSVTTRIPEILIDDTTSTNRTNRQTYKLGSECDNNHPTVNLSNECASDMQFKTSTTELQKQTSN